MSSRKYTHKSDNRTPRREHGRWHQLIAIEFVALAGLLIGLFFIVDNPHFAERQESSAVEEEFTQAEPQVELVGSDYKKVWEENKLPNVEPASVTYDIYGHEKADAYIRQKAEERGYQRQPVASGSLTTIDGYELQPEAAQAWQELKQNAREAGRTLELTSGFRDVGQQQRLFREFFQQYNRGESPDLAMFSSGEYDSALDQTLRRVAPPGYSKHHSGYIIDIGDGANQRYATNFRGSPAQRWISQDNYATARNAGFMPSYPDDVDYQGPNPEPWEFAWVGERSLHYDAIVKAWTSTN